MRQVQEAPAGQQQFEHDGYQQQYGFGTGTHSIFQQQAPAPGEEALKAVGVSAALAGTAPLQPTDLGSRRGLHPTSEALPQVTIEQVKKRLKDRYVSFPSRLLLGGLKSIVQLIQIRWCAFFSSYPCSGLPTDKTIARY